MRRIRQVIRRQPATDVPARSAFEPSQVSLRYHVSDPFAATQTGSTP